MAKLSEELLEIGRPFEAPIPGQSLTNSPDSKRAWEQPPQITSMKEAIEKTFLQIIDENTMPSLLDAMSKQMPVAALTSTILYDGYTKGVWNPDLMTLMIEPTMYMLIAIAEKAGIDPIIYEGENEEDFADEDEDLEVATKQVKDINDSEMSASFGSLRPKEIRQESVTPKVQEMIEELDTEKLQSLLSKPKPEAEEPSSLLAAGE